MDLEALRVSAESGDVRSMIQLAKINFDNGEYFESEELYTRAAENGSVVGYQMSLILKNMLGHAGMQLTDKIYEDNIKEWEESYDWALKWYQQLSDKMDKEQHNQIVEKIDDIRHYLALSYYFSDRFDDVLKLTENSSLIKDSILYGISIIETDFSKDENWKAAYDKLSVIVDNEDYGCAPKGIWEEKAYVLAAGLLSEIYNLGLPGYFDSNIEDSYRVLRFVKSQVKEQVSINLIDQAIKNLDEPDENYGTTSEANSAKTINKNKIKTALCINCGNKINVSGGKCPFCGDNIEYEEDDMGGDLRILDEPSDEPKQGKWKWIMAIVMIMAILVGCIPLVIGLINDEGKDSTNTTIKTTNDTSNNYIEQTTQFSNEHDNEYGYIIPSNIQDAEEYCNYKARIVDAENNLIMRNGPGSKYEKIGSIANKSLIYIIGYSEYDEWVLVYYRYYNKYGWVNDAYLKDVNKAFLSETQDMHNVILDDESYPVKPIDYFKDTVNADVGLVLRNGPSSNSRWILRMENGDDVELWGRYKKDPDWVFIEYNDGVERYLGFANAKYLANYEDLEELDPSWFEYDEPEFIDHDVYSECIVDTYGEYDGESLNMRSGPSRDYDLIVEVPDGSDVELLGFSNKSNDWICVRYKGYAGWVLNKYIFSKDEYDYDSFNVYTYGRISYNTPSHGGLVVRSGPSYYDEEITILPEGTLVDFHDSYYDKNNGYMQISTVDSNEEIGYVLVEYLEFMGTIR